MSKIRDSRIELIRIISMILIVLFHLTMYSGFSIVEDNLSFNYILHIMFGIFGKVGVVLFVSITSWFYVDKKSGGVQLNLKRLAILIIKGWLVSIIFLIIFMICRNNLVNVKIIIKELFTPFYYNGYSGNYWFIYCYIIFYLLLPYLNKLVNCISNGELKRLCIILTIFVNIYNFAFENIGSRFLEFIFVYVAIAYLKKNKNNIIEKNAIMFFIVSYLLVILGVIGLKALGQYFDLKILYKLISHFYERDNLLIQTIAFSIFYIILRLKPFNSKTINKIAKHTLGIYIITDNILLRTGENSILFQGIFSSYQYFNSWYYGIYCLVELVLIFAVCIILDFIIDLIVNEKNIQKIKFIRKINEKYNESV